MAFSTRAPNPAGSASVLVLIARVIVAAYLGRDPGEVLDCGEGMLRSKGLQWFPTKAHFASYCGTAPIEVSSGDVVRHRLSRAGNRQLNYALHVVALSQIRSSTSGQAYYRSKIAAGKSPAEAIRCLKRRLADTVYHRLLDDLTASEPTAA